MDETFSLKGKRILITGAASGMGRAFALHAAADGASVGLLDIDGDGLAATVEQLAQGARSVSVTVDLAEWEPTEAAVQKVIADLGGLDVVASIAGWDAPGVFWEQPLEHWRRLIDVNLWSALYVCRAALPTLIEQRSGSIVFVSSDAGRVGSKGETAYAAAKGGIMALTKSLARELAPYAIPVNCVCPGPTMTPLLEQEMLDNPRLMEKMIRAIPLRRVATVEDQARAIAYLASDAANYLTGQLTSVSGGLVMAD
jgi:2-hydroxycyclohexanecarboxyl-CoA dehydrogenase